MEGEVTDQDVENYKKWYSDNGFDMRFPSDEILKGWIKWIWETEAKIRDEFIQSLVADFMKRNED